VINNPKENGHYGGSVAAPIFKELADKVYASDMSIHKALRQSGVAVSLPKVKQGHVEDANNVLANFDINRIVTDEPWMVASTTKTEVSLEVRRIERDLRNGNMPDLRGMGIQDAIYLLESYGLVVEIKGSGSVHSQSISKGNKFIKGSLIKLELA
jgi:cell division protein FtsI (penicillin-binding protein 3)